LVSETNGTNETMTYTYCKWERSNYDADQVRHSRFYCLYKIADQSLLFVGAMEYFPKFNDAKDEPKMGQERTDASFLYALYIINRYWFV
jgi:hypothetical protein